MTSDDVVSFLERYGWTFHASSPKRWVSGWQSDKRSYPLSIELSDTWVSFSVTPFMKLDIDWDSWPDIMRFLLELNHDSQMVSLGIDQDQQLVLQTQLLTESLTYEAFADTISLIGYYAESIYDAIIDRVFTSGVLLDNGSRLLT